MIKDIPFLRENMIFIILIVVILSIIYYAFILIFNKKASDKTKINVIKIILTICSILLIASVIIDSYVSSIYELERGISSDLFGILFLLAAIVGIPAFYLIAFGNIKPPKPEKYLLKQNNYEEFSNYLNKRVKEYDYELIYNKEQLIVYKRLINKKIYYIIDARLEELTELNFDELYNEKISPLIEEDFNKVQKKYYELYVSFIVSVDRITPMFNKFIEETNEEVRYYKLPVGISFGGNKMYLPSMIEGFQVFQINKLKKEFKEIMKVSV